MVAQPVRPSAHSRASVIRTIIINQQDSTSYTETGFIDTGANKVGIIA